MTNYLYVKIHNVTGLKYLGKTSRNDVYIYEGSGKYWQRHIKKYGYDVTTHILLVTEDINELKETGIFFSKLFNVVKSKEWANLMEENGNGMSSEFSSNLQKKRIKEGKMPQVFTTEKTLVHNKKMLELGIHPSQNKNIIKETNRKMLENGTHPFIDKNTRINNQRAVKEHQLQLLANGKHNFKNKVPR